MLKRLLTLSFLLSAPLLFGQLDSNSVTVTASQSVNLQPDQVLFGVSVTTSINATLDDVLAALKGSGITIANFSGLGNGSGFPLNIVNGNPQPATFIQWSFSFAAPIAQLKATVTMLRNLQESLVQTNTGFTLAFTLEGTQVSASLQQSQTCSITGLIADATAQAQKLASAAGLNLGSILAMSSTTSSPANQTISAFLIGSVGFGTTPQNCTLTVKFGLTRF